MSRIRIAMAMAFGSILGMSACVETTQRNLPSGSRAKYDRVALVPAVGDNVVSSYWQAPFSEPVPTPGRLGWDASAATVALVKEQLGPPGATVTAVSAPNSAAAKAHDVVLVLQQTPLNKLGQDYNPGRDLLALGGGIVAIAAVAGAERNRDEAFQPRFVLWIRNPQASKAIIGENACTVGLTASLLDPGTGQPTAQGTRVTGRTIIPDPLSARDWAGLSQSEKARVLGYCQLALRSAVTQALARLDIVE